jgi:heme exporter protein CcmD
MMHFLAMGGYAAFVWPAYAVTLIALAVAIVATLRAYGRAKSLCDKPQIGS